MRPLSGKVNVTPPDGTYPYGRIRDDDGTNNGTPVDENTYGDIHQFFSRIVALGGITANGLPDNAYSGFQLVEALLALNGGTLVKTIELANWDMTADAIKTVAWATIDPALDPKKVTEVRCFIKADPIIGDYAVNNLESDGSVAWNTGGGGIILTRGSSFDNANYNDTGGYVRALVTVRYKP